MISFWIVAALTAAAASSLVLAFARRARGAAEADPTLTIFKRQLSEVDELAERGLLSGAERDSARVEAGRRLLRAADQPRSRGSGRSPSWSVPAAAAVAPVLALGLYLGLGSPGVGDQPYAERLRAWRASPEGLGPNQAAAVLEAVVRERPDDAQAQRLLGRARLAGGDAIGAVGALEASVRMQPRRADVWIDLAEALLALEPPATAEARRALGEALKLAPGDVTARYWLGAASVAEGQAAAGLNQWRALAAELPAGDPRRQALLNEIASASGAGEPAIRAMVEGLAARLREQPDDPEGWARLVRAYAVLGREADLRQALEIARERFGGQELARIEAEAAAGRQLQRGP